MASDDRSDRLRRTRKRSKEKAISETSESSEPSDSSEPSETSEPSKPSEAGETSESSEKRPPVKELLTGTYMYLTDDLDDRVDSEFKRLRYELDDDLEGDFEKIRDYYNLLVATGLDALQDADPEDLAERVEERRRELEGGRDD